LFEHQGYNIISIEEAATGVRTDLSHLVKEFNTKLDEGSRGVEGLKSSIKGLENQNETIKAEIKKIFDDIVLHVCNREEELMNALSVMYSRKCQQLNAQVDELNLK